MPELPEVETVVRALAPRLAGRTIRSASFTSRLVVREEFAALSSLLAARRILHVERRGKFIAMRLDRGTLTVHLGMTGKLLLDRPAGAHTRALFTLDDGRLVYDDARQFGRIEYGDPEPARLGELGPDALTATQACFAALLRRHRTRIKALLLDQRILAGLGNIYVDEALFAARIHPLARAARLSGRRAGELHYAIVDVLTRAIAAGGSSISDYVDPSGQRGAYQLEHRVYGLAGEPCRVCGHAIRRIVIGQRGTHYCPRCQRA